MTRDSAGAGEQASGQWIAARLREAGAREVRVEQFRYQGTYAWAHAAHAAVGLLSTLLPWRLRASLALGAGASLELEASGRLQWIRRLLPATAGHNVLAGVSGSDAGARRTLVLVAHHDAARTGLVWQPWIAERGAERRLRRRRIDPFMAPTIAGLALAAAGFTRTGRILLALSVLADADIARSPTVPGASDNATGVAALIELTRRFAAAPLSHTHVIALAPGCEESGMGGMAAFLRGAQLDPSSTLVLGLDTLGAGQPIVCRSEGAVLEHAYRQADLDLADRGAARVGLPAPQRWRIGAWTDPILARFAGLPALSLLSIGPRGLFTNYHRLSDKPENVDWACVEQCVELAWGIAQEFSSG